MYISLNVCYLCLALFLEVYQKNIYLFQNHYKTVIIREVISFISIEKFDSQMSIKRSDALFQCLHFHTYSIDCNLEQQLRLSQTVWCVATSNEQKEICFLKLEEYIIFMDANLQLNSFPSTSKSITYFLLLVVVHILFMTLETIFITNRIPR